LDRVVGAPDQGLVAVDDLPHASLGHGSISLMTCSRSETGPCGFARDLGPEVQLRLASSQVGEAALAASGLGRDGDNRATTANTIASLGQKTARHWRPFQEAGWMIYLPPSPTPGDGTFVFGRSAY
jgi:hypothetical protein